MVFYLCGEHAGAAEREGREDGDWCVHFDGAVVAI